MNDVPKTTVFLTVLVSAWLYTSTWAETFPPLNCSTSSVRSCDAYIYLRNVTEPIDSVASRFNISAQQITPYTASNYLAKIRCSCLDFLRYEAFFYRVNHTVQPSDMGLVERDIFDKYFSYTAWTERQLNTYKTGDKVELALGCGCPIPGWHSIVSYAIPPNGTLSGTTGKFESNMDEIISLNNIQNQNSLQMNRAYLSLIKRMGQLQHFNLLFLNPAWDQSKDNSNKTQILLEVLLPIAGAISYYYCCCKRDSSPRSSEIITLDGTEHREQTGDLDKSDSLPTLTNLTHYEIIQMESYCNESCQIGEGSFGKVYMGNLKDKDVAIKKIKRKGKESKKLVENEVRLLQGKQHKNLVSMVAWYIEEHTFYLVYEYVNGCTLDEYLRENLAHFSLNWKRCLRIISNIAEGIEFLHLNSIIHVDIKPQNLMVDIKDNEVKIIDFGFSRHVDWEGTHRSTDRITGTRGYWAPEYCLNHKLSYKHDVYSFGIVVLEVITGQKHVDNARGSSQFHIPDYVRYMMASNRLEEALDERLRGEGFDDCDLMNALVVANLALKCAEQDKEERPDMSYVMRVLNTMSKENTEGNSSGMVD